MIKKLSSLGLCLLIAASNSVASTPGAAENTTPIFACMSFQQQRESVESFLALLEIQAKYPRAVKEDRRLEQTCFNLDLVKDEASIEKILKQIGQDREGIRVASPQLNSMSASSISNSIDNGILLYSMNDLNLSYNVRDQKRNEMAFQISHQLNQKEKPQEKNMFDNLPKPKKSFTYGITYFGSTEYIVRRAMGGGTINLSQKLSAVIAKTLALMWGDVYFNEPLPQGQGTGTHERINYEVKVYNIYDSLGLNQDLFAETKTKAVFFFRYDF